MLRREAANWLARLQSGRDPEMVSKFQQWRDADARNAAAFDRIRRSYEQAGLLRHSPVAASGQEEIPIRRPGWLPRPALAAAAALVVLVPIGLLFLPLSDAQALMLTTRVGEIREVSLADGSRVTLDTATRVEVEIGRSRRTAHLRYGRARFQVARSAAPFVVETADATVTTRSGVIDVDQSGQNGRVQVLEGAAEVRGSTGGQASPLAIAAGEGVTVSPTGSNRKALAAPGPDWTRGMLQFDGTALADAVALANRYSQRQIVLRGNLDSLRVTGAFRAGDITGLAKALASAFGLSLQPDADGNLTLSRSASSTPKKKIGG